RKVMRQIKEKWPVFVLLDELNRSLGVLGREFFLIGVGHVRIDRLLAFDQRQRRVTCRSTPRMLGPHVVGIWQSKILIEAVPRRQKLRMMPEVPLAGHAGGVALLLYDLGQ